MENPTGWCVANKDGLVDNWINWGWQFSTIFAKSLVKRPVARTCIMQADHWCVHSMTYTKHKCGQLLLFGNGTCLSTDTPPPMLLSSFEVVGGGCKKPIKPHDGSGTGGGRPRRDSVLAECQHSFGRFKATIHAFLNK